MQAVLWHVQAPLWDLDAVPGDAVSTYEWGDAVRWRLVDDEWDKHVTEGVSVDTIAAWWAAGVIVPASPQDADRARVHQLLHVAA